MRMVTPMRKHLSVILKSLAGCILLSAGFPAAGTAQDYTQPPFQLPGGQNNTANRYQGLSNIGTNPFAEDDEGEGEPGDSTRKRKERKPLESYFFDDSTRSRNTFAWTIDRYRNKVEPVDIDTMMTGFQVMYPFLQKGVGDAYQGPLGGASIPLNYFDRPQYFNFSFAQAYDAYSFFPDNVGFYNVKLPFTRFMYMTAGKKSTAEENFGIAHAQNISPSTGFNVDYKSRGTKGIYDWQRTRAKNLSVAFSHTGKKYSVHAGYIYNTIQNRENGGITDDRNITDTIFELAQNVPVNLRSARNEIKDNTFYITQSYGVPLRKITEEDFTIADRSTIFFGHSFEYSRWKKTYTDSRDRSEEDYYHNWFIDPEATYDSICETLVSNRAFIQVQPFDRDGIVGVIDAGAGMDNHFYYQFIPDHFVSGVGDGVKKTSYYVYGSVEGKFRRYVDWGGNIMFHPAGYRSGDINVGGNIALNAFIKGKPITLSGKFRHDRKSPDYWSTRLFSNHYVWSNSFDKENETRFDVTLSMPDADFEVGLSQSVVNNKIYYDDTRHPVQTSESVSVTGLYARKDFRFGGFHFNHRVLMQWSTSQEVIPVPLASTYLSYFFEFNVVKNVLRMQFGLDGRYNTKYYAYGWNPATTTFYNQREKKTGAYPMVDVFLSAKWKRMRILLKVEHLNDDLIGNRNYFSIPHYPLNQRIFKFGFCWNFYD